MEKKSQSVLKKQKKLFGAVVGGILLLSLVFGYFFMGDTKSTKPQQREMSLDLPMDKINPQDVWMNRMETQNMMFDKKLEYIETQVLSGQDHEKKELKSQISELRSILKEKEVENLKQKEIPLSQPEDPLLAPVTEPVIPYTFVPLAELSMEDPIATIKNVANAIPSGTSVKALLVSSVDASCGVFSINDPIPVKLRILDDGHLPKNVDVTLKGGIVIGSAYGNLSSERVYIRMERLTQVNHEGDFVETEIAGFVSGEDGKYGVRGSVVDRSGKVIKNAAISGLFGEASSILQSAVGRWRVENYMSTSQGVTGNGPITPDMGGSSNAFDMLADYYIQRSEQIEPVIQIGAGRVVDLTFTHGSEIGELHTKEHVKQVRDSARGCS